MRSTLRRYPGQVLVAVLVAATAGGVIVNNTTGGGGGTNLANVWVDANGGTCTRQSTAGAYVDAAACGSMNSAISTAGALRGDTVRMKGGTFAEQKLSSVPGGSSGYVTFRPAEGETVTLGDGGTWSSTDCGGSTGTFRQFCVEGSDWVEIRDMNGYRNAPVASDGGILQIVNQSSTLGSEHVVFRNMNVVAFRIYGKVDDIQMLNSEIGGVHGTDPHTIISYGNTTADMPANVAFKGDHFYDIKSTDPTAHMECILGNAFVDLVVSESRFDDCGRGTTVSTGAIHFNNDLGAASGLVIRNNIFNSQAASEVVLNSDLGGTVLVEFNTVDGNIDMTDAPGAGSYTFRGNYTRGINCVAGATFAYNVSTGGTCGGTDTTVGSLSFADSPNFDLHLGVGAGSPPKGFVASGCPAIDVDGDARPATFCDAGADEVP